MTPRDHGRAAFMALLQAAASSLAACCPLPPSIFHLSSGGAQLRPGQSAPMPEQTGPDHA